VKVINFEVPIQGLFLNKGDDDTNQSFIIFETHDNQLDFNQLEIDFEEDTHKFLQCREIVKRLTHHDPIQYSDFVIKDGKVFAIALRQSGEFDLYYDMIKVQTPPRSKTKYIINLINSCLKSCDQPQRLLY
jgi:hypothetical protein